MLDNYEIALDNFERSLSLSRTIKHPLGIAVSLLGLGDLRRLTGDHKESQQFYEQSLELFCRHGIESGAT